MTWARATLLRGASSGSIWEVDSKYPQARVVVGSASNAGWVVTGPGISPFHVELYWDGTTLYVSDPQGAGDVRLNGQPIHTWTQVQGRAQLVFGRAIMDLETSVVEPSVVLLNPTTAPRISAPLVGEATRVQNVDESFEAESTRVLPSSFDEVQPSRSVPPRAPPPPPGHPGPRAVPPPPQREVQETLAVPVEGMAERPRLGADAAPIGQDATRMIDGAAMFAAGKPSVTVSQGVAPVIAGSAYIAKQPVGFAPPAGTPSFAPQQPSFGGQPQPGFGQPQPGFGQPQPAFGQPAAPMMAASPATQPAIAAPPPPMATGQFVPPPLHNDGAPTAGSTSSIPTRTRILLLLFIVGAGLSIGFQQYRARQAREFAAQVAARQQAAQQAAAQAAQQAGATPGVPGQPGVPAVPGQPAAPGVPAIQQPSPATAWVNPSTFVPVLETTYLVDAGFPRTPDAVAADLVGEGRQEDALVQYEALHAAHPERPEYGVMCEVLRRQILQRCVNGRRWDGTLCTQ